MNRRHFIRGSALALCLKAVGVPALLSLSACSEDHAVATELRLENAKAIYNEDFVKLAALTSHEELEANALRSKLVDKNYRVNTDRLRSNAKEDELIEVEGNLYTESEVVVYTLAASTVLEYSNTMPEITKVVTLDEVDFLGGDLREFRATQGVEECEEACRVDENCNGYTFATPEHSAKQKHNMCWLKKEGFRYKKGENYISGIKI